MGIKAISFDCYGTLIDWESGIADALSEWSRRRGARMERAELLAAFSEAEPVVQSADPELPYPCLLYTSPSPRDGLLSRMPSSA